MVEDSNIELKRIDQTQTTHFKRSFTIVLFLIIVLLFNLFTFMNSSFMKKQFIKENNSVVVERFVNEQFDEFATTIGANKSGDSNNLLTVEQTTPIASAMADYTLGIHWFKAENASLAKEIRHILLSKINDNSSMEAQEVRDTLKTYNESGIYSIINGFNLANMTLLANVITLLLVINIVIIIMCILAGVSIFKSMKELVTLKRLLHILSASGMWTGFFLMLIFTLLALIPLLFSVESLVFGIGFFLEIASGIFLNLVIIGTVIFIISTIVWQVTAKE